MSGWGNGADNPDPPDEWDFREHPEEESTRGQWSAKSAQKLGIREPSSQEKNMADKKEASKKFVMTPAFRVSFPYIFTPQEQKNDDGTINKKYSITMLFPKTADLTGMKQLLIDVATAKFGADRAKWPKLRLPFRDGSEKDYEGYGADVIFCSASAGKIKPGLVDGDVKPIIDPNEFYAGCWAQAKVNAFFYDKKGAGIAFGLGNIQKVRDDVPFSGRTKPEDDFAAIPLPAGAGAAAAGVTKDPLGI